MDIKESWNKLSKTVWLPKLDYIPDVEFTDFQ